MGLLSFSLVILLACCVHSTQGAEDDQQPVVTSWRYGTVYGKVRQSDNGARVNEFLGIPYAVPPVGDLRFKQSLRLSDFNQTVRAYEMPPACPQYSEHPLPWYDLDPGQSEDCLYLNVWAPAYNGTKLRPVKMYVHGGGWFDAGSIRMPYYDGFGEAVDTIDEDGNSKEDGIVVVTVNYRLGVLGFLSSYDEEAPGNLGFGDLTRAMGWVLENIMSFGGDIGNNFDQEPRMFMTVEGQGSGAILVSLLRFYYGIQFRPVLNGATFLTLQALEGVDFQGDAFFNNLRLTDLLSRKLGCGSLINSTNAITCLRGVEVSRLVRTAASLSRGRGPPNVFLPQIFGPYYRFPQNPFSVLHNDAYYGKWDTLNTMTSDEGSALLTSAFPKLFGVFGEKDIPLSAACAKKVTRRFLKKFPVTLADDLLGDLDTEATVANRDKVVQAFGDAYFNCPMVFYAEELKRVKELEDEEDAPGQVYLLEKQVYPPYNPFAAWMGSVGFSNVQINFLHPDGKITVNNQTYSYTDEQSEQARTNQKILRSFTSREELPFPEFKLEDPVYEVLGSDGKLSGERKSNFHKRNCNILRPYFKYQKDKKYGYGAIVNEHGF